VPHFGASALIDTGAILSIVDAREHLHHACVEALQMVRFPLLTSEAVLTEAFHLVGRSPNTIEKLWPFVRSGVLTLGAIGEDNFGALHAMMAQYADRPMDFADATLVHLATRERISTILTIDYDDFETYRLPNRKRFTILPRQF
jgi:uncharacterized protein